MGGNVFYVIYKNSAEFAPHPEVGTQIAICHRHMVFLPYFSRYLVLKFTLGLKILRLLMALFFVPEQKIESGLHSPDRFVSKCAIICKGLIVIAPSNSSQAKAQSFISAAFLQCNRF
jgi:hypothetical protein